MKAVGVWYGVNTINLLWNDEGAFNTFWIASLDWPPSALPTVYFDLLNLRASPSLLVKMPAISGPGRSVP